MLSILKKAMKNYSVHEIGLYSSAMAYKTILTLPALILWLLYVAKLIYGNTSQVEDFIRNISSELPWDSWEILTQFIGNSIEMTWFWVWFLTIGLLLWTWSGLVALFIKAINNSFWLRIDTDKTTFFTTLKLRFFWVIFLIFFGVIIFSSLFFWTVFSQLFDSIFISFFINFVVTFLIFALLYAAIFRFLILVKSDFKTALLSGMFMSSITLISIAVITLILNSLTLTSDFAIWAWLILFLIWINYLTTVIFFWFECINVYMRKKWNLTYQSLADEKYKTHIVVEKTLLWKILWWFQVLESQWKIRKWFVKKNTKKNT